MLFMLSDKPLLIIHLELGFVLPLAVPEAMVYILLIVWNSRIVDSSLLLLYSLLMFSLVYHQVVTSGCESCD